MALWPVSDYFGWKGGEKKHFSEMTKVDAFWLIYFVLFGSLIAIPVSSFLIVRFFSEGWVLLGAVLMLWPIMFVIGVRQSCYVLYRRYRSGPALESTQPDLDEVRARLDHRSRAKVDTKIREVGTRFGLSAKR